MAQQDGLSPPVLCQFYKSFERGRRKFRYFTASEMDSVSGEALWQGRPNQFAAQQPHRNC
jgi:hypothetical protein